MHQKLRESKIQKFQTQTIMVDQFFKTQTIIFKNIGLGSTDFFLEIWSRTKIFLTGMHTLCWNNLENYRLSKELRIMPE